MIATVVTPCYNHNEEVKQAIQSALNQSEPVEIILVDDGSDTPVENIWGNKVKVIRHPHNMGLSQALNTGVEASKTDRFVICSADDRLHPEYVKLTSEHDADIVSVDMFAGGGHVRCRAGDLEILKHSNCHSYAALVKKEMWRKVGGFKVGMDPSWEDYEFWLNCAKYGAVWSHVSLPLHIYNRNPHGRDVTAQGQDRLLRGLLEGHHQDLFGKGKGVVAFVIPCYNQERFLTDALVSIVNQTYSHVAIVVVDDGSNPPISELKTVPVIRQENKGLATARNAGIKYALDTWNPEYFVMLDADDKVDPRFVSRTLGSMHKPNEFVYTDVQFIGDAWHVHKLEDFDCRKLSQKHLHSCTFLVPAIAMRALIKKRGYVYDESQTMRIGFEDWENSIALVEAGFCGKRVPEPLFQYRFHNNGSMRTRAEKERPKLVKYIRQQHPQMNGGDSTMCTSCGGGGSYTTKGGKMQVANVGEVQPGEPIEVTYHGSNLSTQTKIGIGGRIIKYSGKEVGPGVRFPKVFVIDARNTYQFPNPPFTFRKLSEPKGGELPDEITTESFSAPKKEVSKGAATASELLGEDDGFDFTQLQGVGPATNAKLRAGGVTSLDQLKGMTENDIAEVLGHRRAAQILLQAVVNHG